MGNTSADAIITALGRVVVNFASLEFTLGTAIILLLNIDQKVGQILVSKLPFKGRIDVFDALVRYQKPNMASGAQHVDIITNLGQLEDRRNQIVHSAWAAAKQPTELTRVKVNVRRKRGLSFTFEPYDETKVLELAQEIKQATEKVLNYAISLIEGK